MALQPQEGVPKHSCWAAVAGTQCTKALSDNCSTDFSCSGCIMNQSAVKLLTNAWRTHHARQAPRAADKVWTAANSGVFTNIPPVLCPCSPPVKASTLHSQPG